METRLHLEILPQPDDNTCGPTCLQSVYAYYHDGISLKQVVEEVQMIEGGGTLAVLLGCHARARGYKVTLYTFDMQVFDPTWFPLSAREMADKLKLQLTAKKGGKIEVITKFYLDFIAMGGEIKLADLTSNLLRSFLKKGIPIITGLSATYLYHSAREIVRHNRLFYDDIYGEPTGHFVVLSAYYAKTRSAMLADPLNPNPISNIQHYEVKLNRLIPAIMLATLTFDANLLVITPEK